MKFKTIGEAVDRLVTVPMSNWTILKGLPLIDLYNAARKKAGMPLTLKAAQKIKERVKPGDHIIFLTGFVIPHFQKAETDGPLVAVATPYIDRVNEKEKRFLEDNGFNVPVVKGLQIIDAEILHAQTADTIYEMIVSMDSKEVDGFFISCTDFRGLEVADHLEKKLKKPVVTSNQATLWGLFKLVNYKEKIEGYGRLLEEI